MTHIASRGATMAVDWEQRVDFNRLRTHRLARTKQMLAGSELGCLLLFDPNNLRYVTSTAIGTWERDKNIRFALVFREDDPILWDFGSAARHHQLYCPWLQVLFDLGSEHVEAINAISGDRCNPHPHTFSDRLIRPGDQAFFDIIHSFMGYRTCYYRTFNVGYATPSQLDAYKQCREWLDDAIARVRPGETTDSIAEVWPAAQEIGMKDERAAFGLQFGHGLGVGLYESPMISRLHSFDDPVELEVGMVFALETYCAASDGHSAARIEEEVVVTPEGPRVITRFPADELLVTGRQYVRGADVTNNGVVV